MAGVRYETSWGRGRGGWGEGARIFAIYGNSSRKCMRRRTREWGVVREGALREEVLVHFTTLRTIFVSPLCMYLVSPLWD